MAVKYDSIKTMRAAKIGTIMPWGGDGGNGFLESKNPVPPSPPQGMIVPILAALIVLIES